LIAHAWKSRSVVALVSPRNAEKTKCGAFDNIIRCVIIRFAGYQIVGAVVVHSPRACNNVSGGGEMSDTRKLARNSARDNDDDDRMDAIAQR
jgi:hypothetical protein